MAEELDVIPRHKGALPVLSIMKDGQVCHFYLDGRTIADEGFPSYGIINHMSSLFAALGELTAKVMQSSSQTRDGEIHQSAVRMAQLLQMHVPQTQEQERSSK